MKYQGNASIPKAHYPWHVGGPGTATTEFSICIGDQPELDYQADTVNFSARVIILDSPAYLYKKLRR